MKGMIRKVSKSVGVNPVARAVAKQALSRSITDYKIAFYMLDEGESCAGLTDSITLPLRAMVLVLHWQEPDSPDYRKLRSAGNVLSELWNRGTWRKADTVTLDNALEILLARWPGVAPDVANKAIHQATDSMFYLEYAQ